MLRRSLLSPAAALLLALAGCTAGSAADPAVATGPVTSVEQLSPTCPAVDEPQVVTVDQVNQVVADADLPGWQAADIGASARLSDGRLVWVFGDTVRAAGTDPRIVANSVLVSSGTCVSQLVAADGGPVIPDVAEDTVRWPMSVAVLPPTPAQAAGGTTDVVVVLCADTRRGAGGALDFSFLGTSAAVFGVGADGVPHLFRTVQVTADVDDATQVNWGAAAAVSADWWYVYGTRLPAADAFGRELYVARVPVASPGDRSTWQFWDGGSWQSDIERSAAVLGSAGGVSQTLSVDQVDGAWVAVSKQDGDLGSTVATWWSAGPTGPWTRQAALTLPAGDPTALTYAPLAHPEIPLASGGLLVSISRNTTDGAHLLADPAVGRPVFVEVTRP